MTSSEVCWVQDLEDAPVLVRLTEEGDAETGPFCRLVCGTLLTPNPGGDDIIPCSDTDADRTSAVPEACGRHALVCLPCTSGGLGSLSAAAEPGIAQQLPSQEALLPLSQIWRTREPTCCEAASSSVASAEPATGQTAGEFATGQAGVAPWVVFTWASGTPVAGPPQHAHAALLSPASDACFHAAAACAVEGKGAVQGLEEIPISQPEQQPNQRKAMFVGAGIGETADWAAASGGIWAVQTLRDLIRRSPCTACQ